MPEPALLTNVSIGLRQTGRVLWFLYRRRQRQNECVASGPDQVTASVNVTGILAKITTAT